MTNESILLVAASIVTIVIILICLKIEDDRK
jgi:hypothetical protein